QRRAHRGRRVVSNAATALPADVLVLLVESPEPYRPPIEVVENRYDRPVIVFDLRPEFGAYARRADGTGVPRDRRLASRRLQRRIVCRRQLGPAILERPLALRRDLSLGFLDQRGQRRLRVGRYRQIHFGEAVEFLVVGFGVKI